MEYLELENYIIERRWIGAPTLYDFELNKEHIEKEGFEKLFKSASHHNFCVSKSNALYYLQMLTVYNILEKKRLAAENAELKAQLEAIKGILNSEPEVFKGTA